MSLRRTLLAVSLIPALAACVATPQAPSESRPAPMAMNIAMDAPSCTVVSVRQVHLTQPYTNTGYGMRAAPSVGPRQAMGGTGGALVGAALGRELGGSDGALVGALLGAMAGGAMGAQSDRTAPYSYGQEVVVRTAEGRQMLVVQGTSPSDRPLYPGSPCALVGGRGYGATGQTRVIGL